MNSADVEHWDILAETRRKSLDLLKETFERSVILGAKVIESADYDCRDGVGEADQKLEDDGINPET